MTTTTDPVILVVEDEPAQMELLAYNLQQQGYQVLRAADGEEALLQVEETPPDLILLDWMLPHLSGLKVCRSLKGNKKTREIPIIMLTARGEEDDRIRGLDTGADDYVVKPYSIKELLARVRAMLRRLRPGSVTERLEYEGLVVDMGQHRVTVNGVPVDLGPTEFRLLVTLIEKPGRVWSRDQLLDRVWGRSADVGTRTVDVHVGRLRKSIGDGADNPIRTVRGFGYALGG